MSKNNNSGVSSLVATSTTKRANEKLDINYTTSKELRELIKQWTFKEVAENDEFRTDRGTKLIMHHYIKTHYDIDLPLVVFSAINSAVRTKNKFLELYPLLDLRVKYKPKKKIKKVLPSLFDIAS